MTCVHSTTLRMLLKQTELYILQLQAQRGESMTTEQILVCEQGCKYVPISLASPCKPSSEGGT